MDKTEASLAAIAILYGSPAMEAMGDRVNPAHFEDESCHEVMLAITRLHGDGKFIDVSTIPIGIAEHVQAVLAEGGVANSIAHVDHFIAALHQLNKYRKAQRLGAKLTATTVETDFDPVFSKATASMEDTDDAGAGVSTVKDSVLATLATIGDQYASERILLGFKTGFQLVSERTQGCQKGKLWLLGGLPSAGKSLLAQQWCKHAMLQDGAIVHVVSLEMSKDDWMRRFIANFAKVDVNKAVMEKKPDALNRMKVAGRRIAELPFTISDKGGITLYTLKREMKAAAKAGANYFIIDHLGLLDHGGKEIEGYKKTTSWLKAFAKSRNVFVLCLCQLNGKGEDAAMRGEEPRQGHIAYGSSGPNQDADVIFIVTREGELHCCKQRGGPMNWHVQIEMQGEFSIMKEAKYADALK